MLVPNLQWVVDEEMQLLICRGIRDLILVPQGTPMVDCQWVYTVKSNLECSVNRNKICLVSKGFYQKYGVGYFKIFCPIARLKSICILLSLAVNLERLMFQLDVKNTFLYADLKEEVYMEQPSFTYCLP